MMEAYTKTKPIGTEPEFMKKFMSPISKPLNPSLNGSVGLKSKIFSYCFGP